MYESLSEILLEKGLQSVEMIDLLSLPDDQDSAVRSYLKGVLEMALADDGVNAGDELVAAEAIRAELERLWDEGIDLTVEDGEVTDFQDFWRMLVMLPMSFYHEGIGMVPCHDSLVETLQVGFSLCWDIPLGCNDFEAVLATVPDEVCYDFLMNLEDEARLRCLIRLALAEEGWLFQMNEEMVRSVLLRGGSMVRSGMIQLLDGLGVDFTPEIGAPCDAAWAKTRSCLN